MLLRQIRSVFQSWLLVYALFAVSGAKVLAASASVGRAKKEPDLTHTIFRGSDHHYEQEPASTFSTDALTNFSTGIARLDESRYSWKQNIVTTVFWIGEEAARSNPVPNTQSAWDSSWGRHYGGRDNPINRINFIPARFIPNQNPFYVALPYNDVNHSHTKAEAAQVVPWFRNSFVRDGQSVCKDHWLAIRRGTGSARLSGKMWGRSGLTIGSMSSAVNAPSQS
jgi:hypothetical protein